MISHFIAAAIIPAYENIAEDFSISITKASYLTSLQIAIVGFAPLFWKPISNRYGRRPVWLISTLGSALLNVGCAFSDSYSTMAVCRAFVAFFISPPVGIGSGVVTETYFKKQRGQFMGLWTLLLTLGQWRFHRNVLSCVDDTYADESISGPPLGPFVMGFVVTQTGNYRWIYRVLAIINGVQFLFALFLQPETLYIRKGVQHVGSAFKQEYLIFGRLDPKPLKMYEFIQPLSLFKYPSILIPTIAYSMVFGFCSVLLTVEIPQLFIPKFGFNAQQIGLQFLGIIIGSLIGEQIGGRLSDFWMHRKAKQMAYHAPSPPPPEHRLWLSYFGFVLAMVGLIVFGVRFQQLPAHQYDVSPIVGIAISAVGNQIVTTVSTTYAIDCHFEHSASIGIFINVIRSTWAFIGKSLLLLRREKESTHSYPIPIPSHCDGTHTKPFTTFFFFFSGR